VVAHAVLSTPDDGCKEHPKHVERSCSEIKYRLLSAASRWKLVYIRLVMHGTMNANIPGRHLLVDYCEIKVGGCWEECVVHYNGSEWSGLA
jgi:hypothetical protein